MKAKIEASPGRNNHSLDAVKEVDEVDTDVVGDKTEEKELKEKHQTHLNKSYNLFIIVWAWSGVVIVSESAPSVSMGWLWVLMAGSWRDGCSATTPTKPFIMENVAKLSLNSTQLQLKLALIPLSPTNKRRHFIYKRWHFMKKYPSLS